jgi:hypothetical protein
MIKTLNLKKTLNETRKKINIHDKDKKENTKKEHKSSEK